MQPPASDLKRRSILVDGVKLDGVDGGCDQSGDEAEFVVMVEDDLGRVDAQEGQEFDLLGRQEGGEQEVVGLLRGWLLDIHQNYNSRRARDK